MTENLLAQIQLQRALSDGLVQTLLPVVQEMYYPGIPISDIHHGDLGSFARGTNTEFSPDMDICFLNASHDESRGYKDWTSAGTLELTGHKEGITSLAELESHDPLGARFIRSIFPVLEIYFSAPSGSAYFNYMRTWAGYPGFVFNVSLPHPTYGAIALDINFVYESTHFGIEHSRRFNAYMDRVTSAYGPAVVEQLIRDIRTVKLAAKKLATDPTGWVDRRKKVPGFVIEALFCSRLPPYTREELLNLVREYHWEAAEVLRDKSVGDQNDQILDAGFPLDELLHNMAVDNFSLTRGGWETLRQVAQDHPQN